MIDQIIGSSAVIAGLIIFVISLHTSFRYKKFMVPFVFLAVAFLEYAIAELFWYVFDSQGIEPYRSAIDILYTFYFVFAILHVVATLKSLHGRITIEYLAIPIIIIAFSLGVYAILSVLVGVSLESFILGGFFVALSSILAALALATILKLYDTMLQKTWILIGGSIFVSSLTDVWYYTQENLGGYEYGQFPLMDILWFATDIIIILGIIIHRRTI